VDSFTYEYHRNYAAVSKMIRLTVRRFLKGYFNQAECFYCINGGDDVVYVCLDHRPTGSRQNHNGQAIGREVLLVFEILVRCDKYLECLLFGSA
jgi:hypothetical protein